MPEAIGRDFYNRYTPKISQDLLGCFLVRQYRKCIYRVIITEVEAYRGLHDLASHASRGKTPRNKVMFGRPGYAYVYLIYGMYWMLNVVTEKENFPAAILIRGGIVEGEKEKINLGGPGKLTKFLGIDGKLNGLDLTIGKKLWIESGQFNRKKYQIIKTPRIGINYAKHCKDWKWNYSLGKKK